MLSVFKNRFSVSSVFSVVYDILFRANQSYPCSEIDFSVSSVFSVVYFLRSKVVKEFSFHSCNSCFWQALRGYVFNDIFLLFMISFSVQISAIRVQK